MLKAFWCKFLPADLWPIGECQLTTTPNVGRSDLLDVFNCRNVKDVTQYLHNLAISGIDKCNGRLIIMCPMRFQQLYEQTFKVDCDTVHYKHLARTWEDELLRLNHLYSQLGLKSVASLAPGKVPVPYFLIKYKDIVAK